MLRARAFQLSARLHGASAQVTTRSAAALRRREAVLVASRLGARPSTSLVASPKLVTSLAARPRLVRTPAGCSLVTRAPPPAAMRGIAGLARATAGAPARAQVTWIGAARPVLTAYGTREMSSGRKGGGGRVGALFGLAAVALGKFKYVLVALKLTKLAPVLSMVASSLAYSAIFGPAYGCGMVGLIFIHECGHIMAMRYFGLPFSPMLFIPFVGAVIQMQKLPATAAQSAVVALAGPVVGGVAAGATAFAGHATGSQLLMALGDWGFMINLFNLLPIGGLDGGRVADALHPALPALGLVGGVGLAASGAIANPIFYLILLSGAFQVGGQLFGFSQPPPAHYKMKGGPMIATALAYVGCIGSLVAGMALNNVGRKSPRRIEAEQRGEIIDRAPTGGGDGVYDDYFAEFDDSNSRRDDRWGG